MTRTRDPRTNPAAYLGGPVARKTVLPNGLRVLSDTLPHVDSVSLGLWLPGGTRNDPVGLEGITHFVEHMLFKATETRSTLEIAKAIDDIGGQVNAFTERESMYLFAQTIADHTEEALALLFDLLLHPACLEEEVARERQVVLQEIAHLEDAPEALMHELVPQTTWPDHPLGRPLMGIPDRVSTMGPDCLLSHLSELRAADVMILSAAGRVDHDRLVELAGHLSAGLSPGSAHPGDVAPVFRPERRLVSQPGAQAHFCLAVPGCPHTDEARYAFVVLDTLLGGGSSSRLFQEIRENRGLAYSIDSYLQSYRDAGLFVIAVGTAPDNFESVIDLIQAELRRLREQGPDEEELNRTKKQLRVALALTAESTGFRMRHAALSEMYWGRVLPFEEVLAGVDAVTAEDVHAVAAAVFDREQQALVAIGPFDGQGRAR